MSWNSLVKNGDGGFPFIVRDGTSFAALEGAS